MDSIDQVIERVRAGETDLYEEIVREYEPSVRSVLAAMVPDPNRVADMTQETFITAYQCLDRYQLGTNFSAWLKTIARNMAQNERRSWYRRRDMHERYQSEIEESIEDEVFRIVESLPEDVLDSLRGCVDSLADKTRNVVNGFYFEEKAIKDLAGVLGLTAVAVRVTLHRAREAIGKCMSRKGHGDA